MNGITDVHTKFARSFHFFVWGRTWNSFVSVPDHCFFICYNYFLYEFLINLTLSVIIYAILAVLNHPVARKELSI